MTEERSKIMDDLIAQDADLIEFMASEAACYLYPGEDQQAERAAYAKGCAKAATQLQALAARVKVLEAENERLKVQGLRQLKWKTLAQDRSDELADALEMIANESRDLWARDIACAALGEQQ